MDFNSALQVLSAMNIFDEGMNFIVAFVMIGLVDRAVLEPARERARNRTRNREHAMNEMDSIPDSQFRRMFRMTRPSFERLLELLTDHIGPRSEASIGKAVNSSGSITTLRTALAVTLRWLAGASYLDLCFAFGVAIGSFYADGGILWGTMEAINELFEIGLPLDDENKLQQVAAEYAKYSYGHLSNCISAIDGWVNRTRCPTAAEVLFPLAYRNRKGFWGQVIIAGCEANLRFNIFSCLGTGSTHDTLAWDLSLARRCIIELGMLPPQFYIIGDEAFTCSQQLLTPWGGHGLDEWKDSFNYHLSAMRQCIERAFALLTSKWGIFWRPLQCAFKRWSLVVTVCAKLHNFCIDMNEDESINNPRWHEDVEEGDRHEVELNRAQNPDPERPTGDRRREFTGYFEEKGIRRPNRR